MATDSDPPDGQAPPPAGEQPTAMFNKKMHDYFSSLVDPSEFGAPPAAPAESGDSLADSLADSLGPASTRLSTPPPAPRPAAGSLPSPLDLGPAVREGAVQPQLRPAESTRTMTISGPPPPMRIQAPAPLVNQGEDEAPSRVPLVAILIFVGLAVAVGVMYLGLRLMR